MFAAADSAEFLKAKASAAKAFAEGAAVDRATMARLEAAIAKSGPPRDPQSASREFPVKVPGGHTLGVLMFVPKTVKAGTPLPLVLAFGGGPVPKGRRGDAGVEQQARMMRQVWTKAAADAGWLVAAVTDEISRSSSGVRYEIIRPDHLEAVLRGIRTRYDVDEDRTFMTGISLGSNYALQCGACRPELFCGSVPVATEGEARRAVLANLVTYPSYVLVGARDRNIRSIAGPRAFRRVMTELGYDHGYEEEARGGHEGFSHKYPAVLKWFGSRPRRVWRGRVVRVPHPAITAPDRRRYWIAADTRQAAFTSSLDAGTNRLEITAGALTRLDLWLSDRLVDLDRNVRVVVNGVVLHDALVRRDPHLALETVRTTGDRRRVPTARVVVDVPAKVLESKKHRAALDRLVTDSAELPRLAYWEHYALRHLRETRKQAGWTGTAKDLAGGRRGFEIATVEDGAPAAKAGLKVGDIVETFDGNPFFADDDPGALMRMWCLREEYPGTGLMIRVRRASGESAEIRIDLSR